VTRLYQLVDLKGIQHKINALNELILSIQPKKKIERIIYDDEISLGTIFLNDIQQALDEQYNVCFTYSKYQNDEVAERTVIPHLLKEKNRRWYLLAEIADPHSVRIFALDRMSDVYIIPRKTNTRFH